MRVCHAAGPVRSPVGTSFLGEIFSGFFFTCKTNVRKLLAPMAPRISFGYQNHSSHIGFVRMNKSMLCIIFNVHVVSEVAPAFS